MPSTRSRSVPELRRAAKEMWAPRPRASRATLKRDPTPSHQNPFISLRVSLHVENNTHFSAEILAPVL
eukprot:13572492-Alexandrium_andersonii.AAC.1